MSFNLIKAKSKAIVESGPIFRSTAEWEISLSCHNATFSKAGNTLALIKSKSLYQKFISTPLNFHLK